MESLTGTTLHLYTGLIACLCTSGTLAADPSPEEVAGVAEVAGGGAEVVVINVTFKSSFFGLADF